MSFLVTRRWALFFVLVALGAWGAYLLGQWQFHRLEETRTTNHRTATNLAAAPLPVADVMSVHHGVPDHAEWRRVTVHGTYDDAHAVVLKYQTRDGAAGVEVVTPLRTDAGPAVLVDRGWMPTQNTGGERPTLPPSVEGPVTVTGYVRVDATGGAAQVAGGETRAVSSATIARTVPYPLYGGFVDLAAQAPRSAEPLGATELPDDTSDGPHFFYGLQWWFFGALAIFGFFFLMYDEFQRHRSAARS
ncbi:MAG: SURF1 family cytochrome oxidase biogenesis protein [Marmoricola sp.]